MTNVREHHLILVTGEHGDDDRRRIHDAAHPAEVEFVAAPGDNPGLLERASAVAGTLRNGDLAQAPNLAWVHSRLLSWMQAGPTASSAVAGDVGRLASVLDLDEIPPGVRPAAVQVGEAVDLSQPATRE